MPPSTFRLAAIRAGTVACRRCPELRAYCREVARIGERRSGATYWAKPVPSLGHANARLLIVGLAPAAHGGNRTGRMFTGDGSAAFLSRAMHRAGFATAPYSHRRGDGFAPQDAFITAALRCAPPKNKPTAEQLRRCAIHMRRELAVLHEIRVVIGLGKIGFDTAIRRLSEAGYRIPKPRPRFTHLAEAALDPPAGRPPLTLLGSFHPSRQNTNTGKLTSAMFDAAFSRARELLENR
jgi:uracil-DNA glycosylase family 4